MGDDKESKESAKIEKKRLKAQLKAEKAKLKAAESLDKDKDKKEESQQVGVDGTELHAKEGEKTWFEQKEGKTETVQIEPISVPPIAPTPPQVIINLPSEPWWKDPRWISAIIGAVSLSLALIAYFTDII